jgi:predicted PurR-regulated permease PerM
VKRSHAALACLLVSLAVLGGIVTLIGPTVVHQIESFARQAPSYLAQADAAESAIEGRINAMVLPPWLGALIRAGSVQLSQFLVSFGNNAARFALTLGGRIARGLLDIVLAIVVAFWVLTDLPKLREEITTLAGPRYERDAEHLLTTVTKVVGGYLRGQSIASLSSAAMITLGLTVLGVPYAIVAGIIAFFLNFAPYVGPVVNGMIAGLLGLFVNPWTAVAAIIVVIVAQSITDGLVVPRVMSSQVDLHPTLVIFSLLVGGTLFGIAGVIFAIPVAAVGKGLFVYYYERRTERQLSTTNGALFRHSAGSGSPAENPVNPAATTGTTEQE